MTPKGRHMTEKKSFLMYKDYREVLESMNDADAGRLVKALFAHEDGEDVALEGPIQAIFLLLAKQMDRDRVNYEAMCVRNRVNGMKGGRPSKSEANPEEPAETQSEPAETQGQPRKPDKDKDTDTDKDTEEGMFIGGCPPNTHTSSSKPRFKKPSLDEVKAYCAERGCGVDALRFVDFYESKGWMVGKSPMKDWRPPCACGSRTRAPLRAGLKARSSNTSTVRWFDGADI